ncbi:MAG: hypothetical protein Q9227_000144 [Pyrenula ochraceoflavens]
MANILSSNNKFDPNKDIPDLSGKVYIVTGGTAGIGFGISAHILQHQPAALYLLGKKEEHGTEAQEELKKYGDVSKVQWLQCDLEDLKQTDSIAKHLLSTLDRLDALVCNAGLGVGPYAETADGIDSHMQVNHIAQFHLCMTLLPLLIKTQDSRLVLQSSEFHRFAPSSTKFDSLQELNTDIGPSNLYARTKLAQVLLVRDLAARLSDKQSLGFDPQGIKRQHPWINATHPGAVKTDQQAQAVEAYGTMGKVGVKAIRPFMKDPVDEGCRSALFAATSEDVVNEGIQGQYIVPDRKVVEVSDQGKDAELGKRLWDLTVEVLKSKLGEVKYEIP